METVKYIGTATTRIIRENEWEAAGVSRQDTVEWNGENQWEVDASKLSQAAKDALKGDPFFIFTGKAPQVEQEVSVDLDLAAETEMLANKEATDASPTPARPSDPRRKP